MEEHRTRVISWGNPRHTGAAYDFRSDVVTTPSLSLLASITTATLHDDVYSEDNETSSFEHHLATLCGHESAAFVITGTMANQLALRTLLSDLPPYAVLTDASSHVIHFEAGGVSLLSGAMVQAIRPSENREYLSLEDIKKHAVLDDGDVHKTPTRVVSLENTTSGNIIPLAELRRIKTWAGKHGISIHLDGARLWEAVAAGAGTLREFAECADVVCLDCSKNLGAPMGAVVLGSRERIRALKRIRKGLGGGMRQAGVLAAAARQAVIEGFGHGVVCTRPGLRKSHEMAKRIEVMWKRRGGTVLRKVETNMVWVDLKSVGVEVEDWNRIGQKHGVRLDGRRIVTHHQICDEAFQRLERVVEEVFGMLRDSRAKL